MHTVTLIVFALVYLGMIAGKYPGLALDRTGVALLGAIVLMAAGVVAPEHALAVMDVPTMGLLFGLMIVSAQFRLGGFYAAITRKVAAAEVTPPTLLALVMAVSATLSAFLTNDIICLAMAPLLAEGCARRKLDPKPFLIALACATNIGSAATLIGNPQNMLIGQSLNLPFGGYMLEAALPTAAGLAISWAIIAVLSRGRWRGDSAPSHVEPPPFNGWQTGKGIVVLLLLVAGFLFVPAPREVLALGGAGILLLSRKMHSRQMIGEIDWHLLVLFAGLFVVNAALQETGLLAVGMARLAGMGMDIEHPAWLFGITVVLSNLVSNVPATMLLLPAATHEMAGIILTLASTLAGNLFIVGSIANIIVVEQAARQGIPITWRDHARIGVPVTIATLAIAAAWIAIRAAV
ncbi:MAG: membrane protein [Candidatus Hydrogenedentota bacterium]